MCAFMYMLVSVCEWRPEANLGCVAALEELSTSSRNMVSHWL